jgi:hypothetical protein
MQRGVAVPLSTDYSVDARLHSCSLDEVLGKFRRDLRVDSGWGANYIMPELEDPCPLLVSLAGQYGSVHSGTMIRYALSHLHSTAANPFVRHKVVRVLCV